jgi:hypothetical protein
VGVGRPPLAQIDRIDAYAQRRAVRIARRYIGGESLRERARKRLLHSLRGRFAALGEQKRRVDFDVGNMERGRRLRPRLDDRRIGRRAAAEPRQSTCAEQGSAAQRGKHLAEIISASPKFGRLRPMSVPIR